MKVRVFTLRFDPARGSFDDDPLRAFMDEADIIDVQHHFFVQESSPWLLLVLQYRLMERDERSSWPRPPVARSTAPGEPDGGPLDPAQRKLYDALRAWRNARSRTEGVPPYVILTNRQLAALARLSPRSASDLDRVDGFGERKRASYGEDILRVVAADAPAEASP